MPDSLPAVAGTVQLDINPNDFASGTKVDGTALTAANTTPVLTPIGSGNPTYRANMFGSRGAIQVTSAAGWSVPRPVQDDWTIYLVVKSLVGSGAGSSWFSNGSLCNGEAAFTVNDFGLTLRNDGLLTIGVGNPDATGISSGTDTIQRSIIPQIITYTRNKTSGVSNVYLNGILKATVTGNTNSLTGTSIIYFGASLAGIYGRVVAYDATHNGTDQAAVLANLSALYVDTSLLYADKTIVYAVTGTANLKATKVIVEAVLTLGQTGNLRATKNLTYAALGPQNLAARKVVVYGVLGPPPPGAPPEGPDPAVLPPDDCTESTTTPGCCVPDLNRVNEARVGPLDREHDKVVAIQYLQDRLNVLVREFNKLALVTRSNPPSV